MTRFLYFTLYLSAFSTAALFSAKIRKMWAQRISREAHSKKSAALAKDAIWIHASSGEFEYAKPVLKRLKQKNETTLVTYFSPSYSKQVLGHPDVDFAEPLPFDLHGPVSDFFRRNQPRELWIARTDLWPEVIRQAKARNIRICVFSASRSPIEGLKRYLSWFNLRLWNKVDQIYCVSREDKEAFEAWGVTTPIEVLGDTRYDQVQERLRLNKPLYLLENWRMINQTPVLTAGSTWPEDEAVLIEAVAGLLAQDQLRLVMAPHEFSPGHLEHLQKELTKRGLTSQRWTENKAWISQVMIIDQFGILAEAYSYGDFAFVGGSYKAKVHSVMEPLAAGCPTLVGPLHTNNREALEFQNLRLKQGPSMVSSCRDSDAFKAKLTELINTNAFEDIKAQIKAEIAARTGASDRLVQKLLS